MRYRTGSRIALALLAALVAGAGAAAAQEASPGFSFELDPIVFEVLETDLDTDSAKFEEYRDLDSGLRIPRLRLFGANPDRSRTLELRLANVAKEDGRYTLEYGVADRYSLVIDHNKIPHRFGNGGRMLHTRTGPGRFEVADPVQAALQGTLTAQFLANRGAINFNFLNNLIQPYLRASTEVDLGLRRDRTYARLDLAKNRALGWSVEYNHENREGVRPYGAAFGFNNVNELPEPIDYDTTDAALLGRWGGARGVVGFGYRNSRFKNNISTLVWDNPFRATHSTDASAYQSPGSSSVNGAAVGFVDLAPDNEADTIFVNGRAQLGGGWWGGGSLSYIQMTQDEALLPYTLNSSIVGINFNHSTFDPTRAENLPTRNFDGEVDVLSLSADAGTTFAEDWNLVFRYRYYDYDNGSRRIEFPGYVRFEGVWEEIPRISVPFSYSKQDLGAEVSWQATRTTNVALSYNLQSWDREFREIDSSDEDVLKLAVDSTPRRGLTLRASYELGDRSIGDYRVEAQEESFPEPEGVNNQPLLRKYDEAARQYDAWNLSAQWFPRDEWNVFVGVSGRDDDYDESAFGLIADEVLQYNLELGYTPGEANNFYLFANLADREVFQRARQSGATPSNNPLDTWEVTFDEGTDTYGLGWTAKLGGGWTTDLSARLSDSDGFADFFALPGGLPLASPGSGFPPRQAAQDFENYEDVELLAAKLKVDYAITAGATVGAWYLYEDYTIDSFILQGLTNYLPGALLLAAENGDYTANVVALQFKLSF